MRIVKVPGISGGNPGVRDSGMSVLEEIKKIKCSEKGKLIDTSLWDIEEIHVDNSDLENQFELIKANSSEEFERGEKIIFLGGDHSITLPIAKSFLEHCKKERVEPCLIVFDAHPDCHLSESKNKSWLRDLIKLGFPSESILLVGIRSSSKEELEFLAEHKIRRIEMNQLASDLPEATDILMEFSYGKELYISFDIDIIDAIFVPGTERPESGGLTSRQAIYIISRLAMMKNLRTFDLVEIDSEQDRNKEGVTLKLAAKLISELL